MSEYEYDLDDVGQGRAAGRVDMIEAIKQQIVWQLEEYSGHLPESLHDRAIELLLEVNRALTEVETLLTPWAQGYREAYHARRIARNADPEWQAGATDRLRKQISGFAGFEGYDWNAPVLKTGEFSIDVPEHVMEWERWRGTDECMEPECPVKLQVRTRLYQLNYDGGIVGIRVAVYHERKYNLQHYWPVEKMTADELASTVAIQISEAKLELRKRFHTEAR